MAGSKVGRQQARLAERLAGRKFDSRKVGRQQVRQTKRLAGSKPDRKTNYG